MPTPGPETRFYEQHVNLMLSSYRHWTGRELCLIDHQDPAEIARQVYTAGFFLASHAGGTSPVLNYGNQTAQRLFEMDWTTFVSTESRYTAEPAERSERQRLLETVSHQGYIDDYAGVRISSSGKRFYIRNVKVWNLIDKNESYQGQAAYFENWEYLGENDGALEK